MIFDQLIHCNLYLTLSPRIKQAFEYIQTVNLKTLEVGRHEIDGKFMFAFVQQYNTKQKEHGVWEAHRRYIDLQYVFQGKEKVCFAPINRLVLGEYDHERDFLPLSGSGDYLQITAGEFMLLFPHDGHMTGINNGDSSIVKKIVVKIAHE